MQWLTADTLLTSGIRLGHININIRHDSLVYLPKFGLHQLKFRTNNRKFCRSLGGYTHEKIVHVILDSVENEFHVVSFCPRISPLCSVYTNMLKDYCA